jgi:choline dehydrogenase-like flavoprotein
MDYAIGAFQTPQVLELSGIGNREILSKHGIKTIVHLPSVGENLRTSPRTLRPLFRMWQADDGRGVARGPCRCVDHCRGGHDR